AHNIVADPAYAGKRRDQGVQSPSNGVRKALEYAQGCAQDHELLFQQSMKRKGRLTADITGAGQHPRPKLEGHNKKAPEGGNPMMMRSGASHILNPREDDPPPPDRICTARKARGEFKEGYSAECNKMAINWNQDLYRFEVLAYGGEGTRPLYRSTSCPPKHSARNPVTGEQQDGYRTPRRPTEHEQKAREMSGQGVRLLTDHSILEEKAQQHRDGRLTGDENFAKLCKAGVELGAARHAEVSKIKATQWRGLSTNVANALRWED
ncbi:unnamed protein product, partial [Effrenium voratum]